VGYPGPHLPHSSSALHSPPNSRICAAHVSGTTASTRFSPRGRISHSFKEALLELADSLSIPLNVPLENFVMPWATGPTRFTLPNGLEITITGPRFDRVRNWYLQSMKTRLSEGRCFDSTHHRFTCCLRTLRDKFSESRFKNLKTVSGLVCLRLHFNAVKVRLPRERQTAVGCHLFPS